MLCEKCHENQASFIISISEDSSFREIQLCEECATRSKGHEVAGMNRKPAAENRECPECHSRYSQLELLGCPKCYSEFHEELTMALRRIHGSTIHGGKTPARSGASREDVSGKRLVPHRRFIKTHVLAEAGWMQGYGPDCDVVISTRVRLARNLSGHVFCNSATEAELRKVAEVVEEAVADLSEKHASYLENASIIRLENLAPLERDFLIERHLISRDLAEKNKTGKVIIGEEEIASIMLNEEDHVRLQVINPGSQTKESWEMVNSIDDELGQNLDYAFSRDWGYLTACPTNAGTGLRVSVMLHIPALAATKEGNRIISSISNMGYAVRGMYGEGSRTTGAFYQISNEATLGQSEREIVDRINSVAQQIVDREREERRLLMIRSGIKLEDKIFRAYGTLVNARSISSIEALQLLSWVSLGINIDILPGLSRTDIARLLVLTRPAHLQKYEGRKLDAAARDVSRAAVVRAALASRR